MFLTVPVYQISANAARTPHAATFSRLRSSSDFSRLRLLRAAEFWYSGAVRNITVFPMEYKIPQRSPEEEKQAPPPQRKGRDWGGCGSPGLGKQVDKEE